MPQIATWEVKKAGKPARNLPCRPILVNPWQLAYSLCSLLIIDNAYHMDRQSRRSISLGSRGPRGLCEEKPATGPYRLMPYSLTPLLALPHKSEERGRESFLRL